MDSAHLDNEPEGYREPIYRGLHEERRIAGAPWQIALINFMGFFVLGFQAWPFFLIGLGTHIAAVLATKRDPQLFTVIKRHQRYASMYYA